MHPRSSRWQGRDPHESDRARPPPLTRPPEPSHRDGTGFRSGGKRAGTQVGKRRVIDVHHVGHPLLSFSERRPPRSLQASRKLAGPLGRTLRLRRSAPLERDAGHALWGPNGHRADGVWRSEVPNIPVCSHSHARSGGVRQRRSEVKKCMCHRKYLLQCWSVCGRLHGRAIPRRSPACPTPPRRPRRRGRALAAARVCRQCLAPRRPPRWRSAPSARARVGARLGTRCWKVGASVRGSDERSARRTAMAVVLVVVSTGAGRWRVGRPAGQYGKGSAACAPIDGRIGRTMQAASGQAAGRRIGRLVLPQSNHAASTAASASGMPSGYA